MPIPPVSPLSGQLRACWRLVKLLPWLALGWSLSHLLSSGRLQQVMPLWFRGLMSVLGIRHRGLTRDSVVPITDEPVLFVANHQSWLDIPVLGCILPVSFVAKSEVARWPVFGAMARGAGTIFIERGAFRTRETIEAMKEQLQAGRSVLFFPEGTTYAGPEVGHFHARLFAAAVETGVRVQPIYLSYDEPYRKPDQAPVVPFIDNEDFLPHLWRLLQQRGIRARVQCLPDYPLPTDALRKRISRQAQSRIRRRDQDVDLAVLWRSSMVANSRVSVSS